MRVGQVVLVLDYSDAPTGWRMSTTDGATTFTAVEADANAELRGSLPIGIAAVLAGVLAVLFLLTHRRWALPAASVALLAASVPMELEGSPDVATVVMGAAALVPAVAFGYRLRVHLYGRVAILGVMAGAVVAWAVIRLGVGDGYAPAEGLRQDLAIAGSVALVLERTVLPGMTRQSLRLMRPGLFDLSAFGVFAITALLLATVLNVPVLATAGILLVALAFVPAARRRFGRPLEDVLLADIRQQAAAEAAEAERGKLARELHDVPLQELAAVIRRLEILPGAEAESEDLRALAGHLRNVATELRPPVLDDLGLPAGLDFLAEEATTASMPVTAEVIDDTGFGTDRRPPTDVELAMYRIASEAVGNAVRHSGGSKVEVAARVAPDLVEMVIRDDGAGLSSEAAREAAKRKRMGLASMRRRAEAIDAELSIEGSAVGTTVRAVWRA